MIVTSTVVRRIDHDTWMLSDGRSTVRCEEELVLVGVRYTFYVGESNSVVVRRSKVPWNDNLRKDLFGQSIAQGTYESIINHRAVLPKRKINAVKWYTSDVACFKSTYGFDKNEDPVAAVREGRFTSSGAIFALLGMDHPAVEEAVWMEEISSAMKRHRCVWVTTSMCKNASIMETDGFLRLVDACVLVRNEKRATFKWAADQLETAAPLPAEWIDDMDVGPTDDLSCNVGDFSAAVDSFVDSKRLANTMISQETIQRNPFVFSPDLVVKVPRSRARSYIHTENVPKSLIVSDFISCWVTLMDGNKPVTTAVSVTDDTMIVVDGTTMMSRVEAITKLRSFHISGSRDLKKLPDGCLFDRVFLVQDSSLHSCWMREASRFGPVTLIKIH